MDRKRFWSSILSVDFEGVGSSGLSSKNNFRPQSRSELGLRNDVSHSLQRLVQGSCWVDLAQHLKTMWIMGGLDISRSSQARGSSGPLSSSPDLRSSTGRW